MAAASSSDFSALLVRASEALVSAATRACGRGALIPRAVGRIKAGVRSGGVGARLLLALELHQRVALLVQRGEVGMRRLASCGGETPALIPHATTH